MSGIIKGKNQKPIIVNGVKNHVHIFVGLKPSMAVSDLVRDIKNNSSNFINEKKWVRGKFSWQEGFGSFSYSHSQIEQVYNYILNQEKHHKQKTFREEYLEFLKKFDIEYDERYLFDWENNVTLIRVLFFRCLSIAIILSPLRGSAPSYHVNGYNPVSP